MFRTWCCYTLALAALALHAGSTVAQELRYKFSAGTKNSYVMEQNQTMKMSAMGQEFEIKINMSMELSQAIDRVDTATGNAVMKQKIERVKMKMEGGPIGSMEYDSKSDKEPEGALAAMAGIMKAMTESEISMTMSPLGEVSNIKMPEKLMEEMKNLGGGAGGLGGNMFSEDQFKNMLNQSVMILPKNAPVAGSTKWDRSFDMKMGPIGSMKTTTKYTYAGKSGSFDKIDMSIDMKMEPDPNAPIQMKMTTKEANGNTLFDNAKGRVQEVNMKTISEMDMGGIGTAQMTQIMTLKLR
ncbi:MAG TPA: DUF6263 family protein [Gemmatales bacterium]|nr:DUF6263 family protein [Gemmatales bacterium]